MTLFELAAKITLDDSEYEKGIKGALGTADKFAQKLDGGINKLLKIGAVAGGTAVAAVVAFGKASVQTGMQFDSAMSQVAATMGVTTEEIGELRDFAQQMGATTAFSANQAAEALNYMALAGYDADTSMGMLPNVLNLAAAGAMDLGRASDMLTDSQSALGLSLDETNELVDKMAQAASKSNTSVSQLGDAILTVGGTAKNLSGGTTELATALGVLADNGVKGAEGGIALRNIILALSAPTDTAAKAMKELGVDAFDAEGNMRGLNEIFGDLNESLSTMTQQDRMDALSTIFNNRDLKSAEALLANYGDRWDVLSGYIDDASGAAQKMADTQLDNLNGDITLMKSALEGAKISLSDGLTPAIRNAVQTVTKALSKSTTQKYLRDIGEQIGKVITAMTKWTANALPRVIKLFENGAPKVKAFGISVGAIIVAVKAAVNPIGALTSALALLGGGLAVAALGADTFRQKYSGLTDAELDNIDAALESADAYEALRNERNKGLRSIVEETDKTRALWEELQTLVGENGEVDESNRERVAYITDYLNETLGTQLSIENDILQNYKDQADAIDNLIKKRQAERMIQQGESVYQAATEQLPQVQKDLALASKELDNFNERLTTYQDSYNALVEAGLGESYTGKQYQAWIKEAQANVDAAQAEYSKLLAQEQAIYADISEFKEAELALYEGNAERVIEIYERSAIEREKAAVESGRVTEEELATIEKNMKAAELAAKRHAEGVLEGLEGFSVDTFIELNHEAQEWKDLYNAALESIADEAYSKGKDTADNFASGIRGGIDNVSGAINSMFGLFGGGALSPSYGHSGGRGYVTPYSHAVGQDYVPYDNYLALLHRGETVLTRADAKEYREGGGEGNTFAPVINIYGATRADIEWIKEELEREWGA